MQGYAADDLDVEVAQPDRADGRLAHGSERLGQEVVERLTLGMTLPEERRHPVELLVRHGLEARLELVHATSELLELLELAIRTHREDLGEEVGHGSPFVVR